MKKEDFFKAGIRSIEFFAPHLKGHYACPLCLVLFNSFDDLTLEHVPPASFGGQILCLTCRRCNNVAGSQAEGHMHKEASSRSMFDVREDWHPAIVNYEGIKLNVGVRQRDGRMELDGQPQRNNPAIHTEFVKKIGSGGIGANFEIRSGIKFDPIKSAAGFLKSAYLVAFSKFGYRYAFGPACNKLRDQISNPADQILPQYRIKIEGSNTGTLKLLRVSSPVECLLVQFGTIGIPLPGLSDIDTSVYTHLIDSCEGSASGSIKHDEISWPDGMEMLIDRQLEEVRRSDR